MSGFGWLWVHKLFIGLRAKSSFKGHHKDVSEGVYGVIYSCISVLESVLLGFTRVAYRGRNCKNRAEFWGTLS